MCSFKRIVSFSNSWFKSALFYFYQRWFVIVASVACLTPLTSLIRHQQCLILPWCLHVQYMRCDQKQMRRISIWIILKTPLFWNLFRPSHCLFKCTFCSGPSTAERPWWTRPYQLWWGNLVGSMTYPCPHTHSPWIFFSCRLYAALASVAMKIHASISAWTQWGSGMWGDLTGSVG